MKTKGISIKQIAEYSGVSVATVSRVINNNGSFTEATKKKVMDVVESTGYRTNNIAKSLRMNRSYTIGILVSDIRTAFFSNIVKKIEEFMFEKNYLTIICNAGRSLEKEKRYLQKLEGNMVDGLISISTPGEVSFPSVHSDIPIVYIDREASDVHDAVLVESDHYHGGYLAAKELILNGCKNIITILYKNTLSSLEQRLMGLKFAMKEHDIPFCQENLLFVDSMATVSRTEQVERLLSQKLRDSPNIDGIFAMNDQFAVDAIFTCETLMKKVPEDIQIIGFNDDPISRFSKPKLTTIRQDYNEIALQSSRTLLALMEDRNAFVSKHQVIPVSLILRQSTKQKKGSFL